MAIKNASDLLVYAKTATAVAQETRIRILSSTPLIDFTSGENVLLSNITNASGVITDDQIISGISNTGESILNLTKNMLNSSYGYEVTSVATDPTNNLYKYVDVTNGSAGIVPTLEFSDGTATFNEDAVIIEIITPGSLAIFDPVAYSTSASFSTNMDLRDITNKDSGGWSESLGGLKSFEVSTDVLQSINPDVPLDGTDFFDKLKNRSLVDLSFSDRIRNIIRTNLTQYGVDGFNSAGITQVNLQADPFGGSTASTIESTSVDQDRLEYHIDAARLEGKKLTWSFYVKESTSDIASFYVTAITSAQYTPRIISGNGSEEITSIGGGYFKITNLDSTWCRVAIEFSNPVNVTNGNSTVQFRIFPGLYNSQSSDKIFTSSWQIEFSPEATDYQDPTDITHWQGNALVSSVSFDASVEDNLTCSATFTGTGNIYPNGLGPELIGDTGFDDSSYWTEDGGSVVEDGYGKIIAPSGSADSYILKSGIINSGDRYLLTYTIASASPGTGNIKLQTSFNLPLLKTTGQHKIEFVAANNILKIGRLDNPSNIWLSSISLKKVL